MNQGKKSSTVASKLPKRCTITLAYKKPIQSSSSKSSSTPITVTLPPLSQATISGITLNCLEHGEPVDCYFQVTANNGTVKELKGLIKEEGELDVIARKLRLWIV